MMPLICKSKEISKASNFTKKATPIFQFKCLDVKMSQMIHRVQSSTDVHRMKKSIHGFTISKWSH